MLHCDSVTLLSESQRERETFLQILNVDLFCGYYSFMLVNHLGLSHTWVIIKVPVWQRPWESLEGV